MWVSVRSRLDGSRESTRGLGEVAERLRELVVATTVEHRASAVKHLPELGAAIANALRLRFGRGLSSVCRVWARRLHEERVEVATTDPYPTRSDPDRRERPLIDPVPHRLRVKSQQLGDLSDGEELIARIRWHPVETKRV